MTNVFFTGCTHFQHGNIINLAGRPFASCKEMDEALVENWNKVVGQNDIVYHLGDISWGGVAGWFRRLNGSKYVILGNHDDRKEINAAKGVRIMWVDHYLKLEMPVPLVLMHYPIEDWDGRFSGSIHLHAHTHKKEFRNPSIPYVDTSGLSMEDEDKLREEGRWFVGDERVVPKRYPLTLKCNRFNIGVDATNFTPVEYSEIILESKR